MAGGEGEGVISQVTEGMGKCVQRGERPREGWGKVKVSTVSTQENKNDDHEPTADMLRHLIPPMTP